MTDVLVLGGIRELRRFFVAVRSDACGDVRPEARRQVETIAGGDFEWNDGRRQRYVEPEVLAAAAERALTLLRESRRRSFEVEAKLNDKLNAAAQEDVVRGYTHSI